MCLLACAFVRCWYGLLLYVRACVGVVLSVNACSRLYCSSLCVCYRSCWLLVGIAGSGLCLVVLNGYCMFLIVCDM